MAKKKQSSGFNWAGITQNDDGSYTASSRIEKRRLLKSLHASGYTVRSTQREDGSWKVVAVGILSQTRRKAPSGSGYRPKTQYIRANPKYRPVSTMRRRMIGPPPRPMRIYPGAVGGNQRQWPHTPGPTLASGPSFYQKYMARKQERIAQMQLQKQQGIELNEKMRQERINRERQATVAQLEKQEFARKQLEFQRKQQAEHIRKYMHQPRGTWHGGAVTVPPKREEPKVDRGELQVVREREMTGE